MRTSVLIAPILIFGISISCLLKDCGLIILNNIEWFCDDNGLELLLNSVCAIYGSAAPYPGLRWIHRFGQDYLPFIEGPMPFEIAKKVLKQDTKVMLTCFVYYLGLRIVVMLELVNP